MFLNKKGSRMRIDLMSDNVRGKFRGFLIYAIMTKETPGRRCKFKLKY